MNLNARFQKYLLKPCKGKGRGCSSLILTLNLSHTDLLTYFLARKEKLWILYKTKTTAYAVIFLTKSGKNWGEERSID